MPRLAARFGDRPGGDREAIANRTGAQDSQVIRLLLDEHISPALVARLGEKDVCAQAVPHIGLSRPAGS